MLRRALPSTKHLIGRTFSTAEQAATPSKWKKRLFIATGLAGAGGATVFGFSYSSEKRRQEIEKKIRSVEEKPVPTRAQQLKRLASGEEFDVLVVGGGCTGAADLRRSLGTLGERWKNAAVGVTGAGVALEAQLRGLKVACVEQEDFASGTSSKSTKLLWAGSRYLVKGLVKLFSPSSIMSPDFMGTWHMVLGCFRERTYMLTMNPHITNWVPIAVPLDKWIIWPPPFDYPPAALGPCTGLFVVFFKFYDLLGRYVAPSSFVMSSERARADFPQMDGKRMKYVSVFYEGEHNDARTNLCIAFTAAMYGAAISNYAKVERILFDEKGVARGAEVLDKADPDAKPFEIKAKKIIYCGGPFTDGLRQLSEGQDVKPMVNASGGTHIVLPPYYCPRHIGMVDMMTSRGSFLFFLPWEGYTLVGTTDVKTKPDLHHQVPEDEIQYLINECEKYLSPSLRVRRRDVMSAWYGIRPLCGDPNAKDQSSASRDHVVSHHPTNGITFVSGGKWTTWREMAEDGVDQVVKRHPELKKKAGPSISLETPLLGTGKTDLFPEGYHENLAVNLSQKYDLAFDVAEHLVRNYGTRAGQILEMVDQDTVKGSRSGLYKHYRRLYEGAAATTGYPYLEAEVRYAVNHEYAVSPADVLARRTRLAFLNSTAARLCLPRVVEIMAECLGWSPERALLEHEKAEQLLARDFAGPVPNKEGALLRSACTADVKDVFDSIDVEQKGTLTKSGIGKAAAELGFPLSQAELQKAVSEMDTDKNGEVHFPEFLAWWNSSEKSQDVQKKIFMGTRRGSRWKTIEE